MQIVVCLIVGFFWIGSFRLSSLLSCYSLSFSSFSCATYCPIHTSFQNLPVLLNLKFCRYFIFHKCELKPHATTYQYLLTRCSPPFHAPPRSLTCPNHPVSNNNKNITNSLIISCGPSVFFRLFLTYSHHISSYYVDAFFFDPERISLRCYFCYFSVPVPNFIQSVALVKWWASFQLAFSSIHLDLDTNFLSLTDLLIDFCFFSVRTCFL